MNTLLTLAAVGAGIYWLTKKGPVKPPPPSGRNPNAVPGK